MRNHLYFVLGVTGIVVWVFWASPALMVTLPVSGLVGFITAKLDERRNRKRRVKFLLAELNRIAKSFENQMTIEA